MNESKIELTERLRREGRWPEASKFKDEALRKLRGDGMTKAEAGQAAWGGHGEGVPAPGHATQSLPQTFRQPPSPRRLLAAGVKDGQAPLTFPRFPRPSGNLSGWAAPEPQLDEEAVEGSGHSGGVLRDPQDDIGWALANRNRCIRMFLGKPTVIDTG